MSGDRQSSIMAVLTAIAEQIAAGAPRGWKRAELHGYSTGPDGAGHRGFWFEPEQLNEYGDNDIDVFTGMRELHTVMEAADRLTIELEVESRGRFRAVLSERLDRSFDRGFRYVFDHRSGPPETGEPQTGPAAPEAGDPGEAPALLSEYRRRLAEILEMDTRSDLRHPFRNGTAKRSWPTCLSNYQRISSLCTRSWTATVGEVCCMVMAGSAWSC